MTPFVFHVEHPIPELDAVPGDHIVVEPGQPHAVQVVKATHANFGLILLHLDSGALTPLREEDDAAIPQLRAAVNGSPMSLSVRPRPHLLP